MESVYKRNSDKPADGPGTTAGETEQNLGATAAFGMAKPPPTVAPDNDLLMHLLGGAKKADAASAIVPPMPAGPAVVHRVAPSGGTSQHDILSRMRGAELAANPAPAAPALPASAPVAQQPGAFTQIFSALAGTATRPAGSPDLTATPPAAAPAGGSGAPKSSATTSFGSFGGAAAASTLTGTPNQTSAEVSEPGSPQVLSLTNLFARPATPAAPVEPNSFTVIPAPAPSIPVPASTTSGALSNLGPADSGLDTSVTTLVSRLERPSPTPYVPSVPAPVTPPGAFGGSAATQAFSMQSQPASVPVPAAPEFTAPSEVTRIINASKLREDALRGSGSMAPSGASPGTPAGTVGDQFSRPPFSPQKVIQPGSLSAAGSGSVGAVSSSGHISPLPGGAGMGQMGGGAAAGSMNMPYAQQPHAPIAPIQAPPVNLQPPAAAPPTAAQAGKLQQMVPLLLVIIIFLLVALLVTVVFLLKH